MLSHCVGSFHKSNAEPTASDFTHSKHSVLLTSDSDLTTAFASKHVLLFDPPFTCFHHTFTSFLPFVLCVFFCDWEPLLLLFPPPSSKQMSARGTSGFNTGSGFRLMLHRSATHRRHERNTLDALWLNLKENFTSLYRSPWHFPLIF